MKTLQEVQLSEVQEIWESFSGWYWFVTEYHEGTLAFGLVRGWETEWGYFDLEELRRLRRQSKVWKVSVQNWAFCPCVVDDGAASYSRGSRVPGSPHRAGFGRLSPRSSGERRWRRRWQNNKWQSHPR